MRRVPRFGAQRPGIPRLRDLRVREGIPAHLHWDSDTPLNPRPPGRIEPQTTIRLSPHGPEGRSLRSPPEGPGRANATVVDVSPSRAFGSSASTSIDSNLRSIGDSQPAQLGVRIRVLGTAADKLRSSAGLYGRFAPHNGSRFSGEPSLKSFTESTAVGARLHESSYPEPEGRRIEGGEARDGYAQGSSVCSRWLCGVDRHLTRARPPLSCCPTPSEAGSDRSSRGSARKRLGVRDPAPFLRARVPRGR